MPGKKEKKEKKPKVMGKGKPIPVGKDAKKGKGGRRPSVQNPAFEDAESDDDEVVMAPVVEEAPRKAGGRPLPPCPPAPSFQVRALWTSHIGRGGDNNIERDTGA